MPNQKAKTIRKSYNQLAQDLKGDLGDQIYRTLSRAYMDVDGYDQAFASDPAMANLGDFLYYNTNFDEFVKRALAEILDRCGGG